MVKLLGHVSSGRRIKKKIWKHLKFFLPTLKIPRDITKLRKVIEKRCIALGWLHLVCGVILGVTTIITMQTLYYSNIFTAAGSTLLPLNVLMAMKGVSSILVFMAWFRNMDGGGFLHSFGCFNKIKRFKTWYKRRRKRLYNNRTFHAPHVTIEDGDYMSMNMILKVVDFIVGILVWVSIGRANRRSQTKGVQVVIALLTTTQITTDILAPILTFTVGYFYRLYLDKSENGEEKESDSSDSNSDSSDDSDSR